MNNSVFCFKWLTLTAGGCMALLNRRTFLAVVLLLALVLMLMMAAIVYLVPLY
jgi:hypothetical protein